jgi:hypothetical protein
VSVEELASKIQENLAESWLPRIYRERVLMLRTRSYHFENVRPSMTIAVQHTLLGIELKIGRHRLLCPDLATARYLSVFARAGCNDVAVPYDITKVSQLADELESSWFRMLLLVDDATRGSSTRSTTRLRGLLFANIQRRFWRPVLGHKSPNFAKAQSKDSQLLIQIGFN